MASKKRFTHKTTTRIDEKGRDKIERLALYHDVSMAEIIRDAIESTQDLGENEKKAFKKRRKSDKKERTKYVWVTVDISKEIHQKLKALAKSRKITVSKLCREILVEALNKIDAEKSF